MVARRVCSSADVGVVIVKLLEQDSLDEDVVQRVLYELGLEAEVFFDDESFEIVVEIDGSKVRRPIRPVSPDPLESFLQMHEATFRECV